ncbi:MAG: 2-phospho-L-lactate guanylyltransferase [Actinobacteria bacterium]|nr:2-phospho-L-lactate guanylyltransferase [Actinomycetota bacterium]
MNGHRRHAVLVPVKAFAAAKARLAVVLSPDQRQALARWTADRVVAAAGELPVFVACDDEEVAKWAADHGATMLWHPGIGLNAAVSRSMEQLRHQGFSHVAVAHGDLPRAGSLADLIVPDTITLVPDAKHDGTNVIAVPTSAQFAFSYGAGSFHRHLALAVAGGHRVLVRRDAHLARDIDTPSDLTHPLVQEVLPSWL